MMSIVWISFVCYPFFMNRHDPSRPTSSQESTLPYPDLCKGAKVSLTKTDIKPGKSSGIAKGWSTTIVLAEPIRLGGKVTGERQDTKNIVTLTNVKGVYPNGAFTYRIETDTSWYEVQVVEKSVLPRSPFSETKKQGEREGKREAVIGPEGRTTTVMGDFVKESFLVLQSNQKTGEDAFAFDRTKGVYIVADGLGSKTESAHVARKVTELLIQRLRPHFGAHDIQALFTEVSELLPEGRPKSIETKKKDRGGVTTVTFAIDRGGTENGPFSP